ncbi:MAG: outer membrane protein assembly factor BamB, partial [Burkholderiales bacterium]|nr:outer membrane protein assembly factor BamB [Burkholderiales bacterium]
LRWAKPYSSEAGVGLDERFVFAVDTDGVLNAYLRDGGVSAWRNDKLKHRHLSAPASFGRSVVIGDMAGFVHFLSREDGSFIGRISTDGSQILAAPIVIGANLVIQTKSGSVVALAIE